MPILRPTVPVGRRSSWLTRCHPIRRHRQRHFREVADMNEMQWIWMQLTTFVNCLYDRFDIVEIRRLPSRRQHWDLAQDLHFRLHELYGANHQGDGVFIGVNPRKWYCGSKTDEVALARCLFVDFDGMT